MHRTPSTFPPGILSVSLSIHPRVIDGARPCIEVPVPIDHLPHAKVLLDSLRSLPAELLHHLRIAQQIQQISRKIFSIFRLDEKTCPELIDHGRTGFLVQPEVKRSCG